MIDFKWDIMDFISFNMFWFLSKSISVTKIDFESGKINFSHQYSNGMSKKIVFYIIEIDWKVISISSLTFSPGRVDCWRLEWRWIGLDCYCLYGSSLLLFKAVIIEMKIWRFYCSLISCFIPSSFNFIIIYWYSLYASSKWE